MYIKDKWNRDNLEPNILSAHWLLVLPWAIVSTASTWALQNLLHLVQINVLVLNFWMTLCWDTRQNNLINLYFIVFNGNSYNVSINEISQVFNHDPSVQRLTLQFDGWFNESLSTKIHCLIDENGRACTGEPNTKEIMISCPG